MPILNNPPDPSPKTPRLRCPPGACDAHHHLFGPATKYPFSPDTPSISDDALPETLITMQQVLGLSRGVIVNSAAYGHDYSHVADTLARFPDRFRGIALPPEDMSEAEFARLTKLGVRGVRFFSDKRGTHQPKISPSLAARAFEHGWHVFSDRPIFFLENGFLVFPKSYFFTISPRGPLAGGGGSARL